MDLFFTSLELVCIAIGAGSSFIFCSFFILSLKNHEINPLEYSILKRLSLYSTVSAGLGLAAFAVNMSFLFASGRDVAIGLISAKIIIFSLAFLGELTLRKIHLPTLMRHQKSYYHLSASMMNHQDPLVSTASYSMVSWLFVIFLSAITFREAEISLQLGFAEIIVAYIVAGFLTSRISVVLKEKITPENNAR